MRPWPSFQFHFWLMLAMLIGPACHQTVPDAPQPSRPPSLTVADLPAEVRNRIPAAPRPEAEQRFVHLQQQFEQAQQAQLRARNSSLHQRVDRVRAAGNLQTAMKQEIEALRNEIASQAAGRATEAAQHRLDQLTGLLNQAFCTRPLVFDEVARFLNVQAYFPPQPFTVDDPLIVEPGASVVLTGCHFGAEPGEMRLMVNQATGGYVTLPIEQNGWQDDLILANVPLLPGYPDQAAQLVVLHQDGTRSNPIDVQFKQRRAVARINVLDHPETLYVDCASNTTTDLCEGLKTPDGHGGFYQRDAMAGYHFTFCCSSVTGQDRWVVALKNGWTLPVRNELIPLGNGTWLQNYYGPQQAVFWDQSFFGFTTCNFFNQEGYVKNVQVSIPADSRFQGQIDVTWWVDHSCSGVVYAADILIMGPDGVPYW
jgi:hypothetical protein